MIILQAALPSAGPAAPPAGLAARRTRPVAPPRASDANPLLAGVLAAQIFAPDRQPGDAGGVGAGGDTMAGYAALGVAVGARAATAVVSSPGGKSETLRLGDEIDDWKLVALSRTRVTFERKGVRQDLTVGEPAAASSSETQDQ